MLPCTAPHLLVRVSFSTPTAVLTNVEVAAPRATMPVIRPPPALAGCTAFNVISILRKKRMYMTDYCHNIAMSLVMRGQIAMQIRSEFA